MPNETLDPYKIAQYMLKDYARAVRDLERADKHLRTLFKAMHESGLTKELLNTGFIPANHWRLVEWYSMRLRTPDDETGGQQP